MCGEKSLESIRLKDDLGSPPRVRGKGPAIHTTSVVEVDHPRVCGEKTSSRPPPPKVPGSPPRVRGKDPLFANLGEMPRITPACAGKSQAQLDGFGFTMDHPRVCGEKFNILIIF